MNRNYVYNKTQSKAKTQLRSKGNSIKTKEREIDITQFEKNYKTYS